MDQKKRGNLEGWGGRGHVASFGVRKKGNAVVLTFGILVVALVPSVHSIVLRTYVLRGDTPGVSGR